MTVITGIVTAIRIGIAASRVTYKVAKGTKRGAQWLGRHPNIARYGTVAASTAPLIYDLLNIDYSAIIPKRDTIPYKDRQTRSYMVKSRSRCKQYTSNYAEYKRCLRRQRY